MLPPAVHPPGIEVDPHAVQLLLIATTAAVELPHAIARAVADNAAAMAPPALLLPLLATAAVAPVAAGAAVAAVAAAVEATLCPLAQQLDGLAVL